MVNNKKGVKGSADKRCEMIRRTKTKRDKAGVLSIEAKKCKKIRLIPAGSALAKRETVKQSNSKRFSTRVKEKQAKAARILLDTDSDGSSDENSDLTAKGNNRSNLDGKINGELKGTIMDTNRNGEQMRATMRTTMRATMRATMREESKGKEAGGRLNNLAPND